MRTRLLILLPLVACKASSITLPKPTATTAFVNETSDFVSAELDAIDVASHASNNVLAASVYPGSSVIHSFAHNLYIVGQDGAGDGNSMLVLSPDDKYAPACGKAISDCQFALPEKFDAQDFWAVNANKMYLTAYETADGATPGSISNTVQIYNPLTGQALGAIDVAAGVKALDVADGGEDLLAIVGDGTINLSSLYQVDNHLFVAVDMNVDGPVDPEFPEFVPQLVKTTTDACGFEPGRVAVIDTKTDKVVKSIKLKGANPLGAFIVETGTSNLLLATPGSLSSFDQEPCNGIERIDTAALVSKGQAVSEAQLSNGDAHGGTVFSFDLDSKGNGLAFIGNGTTAAPDYQLIRFTLKSGFGAQLEDAGVKGIQSAGFIVANGQGQAYVSLPYEASPAIYSYDIASGSLLDNLQVRQAAVAVSFYPGPAFIAE